ncbi:MAG: dipicolinate synthase subunit B [Christensenellales bacterium]
MKIGLCVCGSFCTFKNTLITLDELLTAGYDVTPIFSFNVYNLDTRFFKAEDFKKEVEIKTGKKVIATLTEAEPIAKAKLDAILVCPCTGNSLSKIANGISDTPVTLAVKAQLRNDKPVVIALSSNDALGANAKNYGQLLNTKNFFFVPIKQDDPQSKPNSMIAEREYILPTLKFALEGKQFQPKYL